MKIILFLVFAVSFSLQISNAQNQDAKNLPLRILFHENESGGNGWSPDGKLFLTHSASENNTKLWNLETEKIIWEVTLNIEQTINNSSESQTFVWSDSQKFIALKDNNGKIYVLDSDNGKVICKTNARKENLEMMTFSSDETSCRNNFKGKRYR